MAARKVLANEANAFSRGLSPPLPHIKTWTNIVDSAVEGGTQ